jgi:hypothetical protein
MGVEIDSALLTNHYTLYPASFTAESARTGWLHSLSGREQLNLGIDAGFKKDGGREKEDEEGGCRRGWSNEKTNLGI